MKIVSLISENIKALKAVRIDPKGSTVTISGKNAQGKTSVLDSIEYALGGKDTICDEPVRKGQSKARIICDLGDLVVERTFSATSGETQLRVRTKDGKPVKSPQAMLDELCSHVAFDPLSFTRMKPADQVEQLRKLVGLDFTEINAKRQKAYDERTVTGRQLDAAKAQLAGLPFHPDMPEKEVSAAEAQAKLEVIKTQRDANAKVRNELAGANHQQQIALQSARTLAQEIARLESEITLKRKQMGTFNAIAVETEKRIGELNKAAANLVEDDESKILEEIGRLQEINTKIASNRRHAEQNDAVQKLQFTHDKLSHEIESIDQEKRDMLEWAEFPLPGLSFDESRVMLNGVPFTQCSQAQQLKAAVAIGLSLNPKLRVILVRDGSLMDDESMATMREIAEKHDAQIWIEYVNSSDPTAVVIKDGEVVS